MAHSDLCLQRLVIVSFLILNSFFVFSQNDTKGKAFYSTQANYSFFDNVLKNKQFVFLGEQSHGEGAVFDEKVSIIKHLHEKLGFNTIAFESGLYDNYKAYREHSKHKKEINVYNESVGYLWSDTQSFKDLLAYIAEREAKYDTIKIIGFDSQEGSLFENNFSSELTNLFQKHHLELSNKTLKSIEKSLILRDLDQVSTDKKDSLALFQEFDLVLEEFKKIPNLSFDEKIIKQTFLSRMADVSFEIRQLQKQPISVQNPRDRQMAENFIFLTEMFPNEKMICWGASYHFSNKVKDFEYTPVTEEYLTQQAYSEKQNTGYSEYNPGDGQKLLQDALPMGEILKNHFKDKMYSIAFSSYEGDYGLAGSKPFSILTPPSNSMEAILSQDKNDKIYFEFNQKNTESFYCSALGNIPFKAKWGIAFDGLFFIRKSYPPALIKYSENSGVEISEAVFSINGKITDAKTRKGISNADIHIQNSNKSAVANTKGLFAFTISKQNYKDRLIISALGYHSDTISLAQIIKTNRNLFAFRLKPQIVKNLSLDEVVISSVRKNVTADEILEKAKNNIEVNYFQNPYNQQFYFKAQQINNNVLKFNEEALLTTYNAKGINGSNDASNSYFGELLQVRNTTDTIPKDNYSGVGYMGFLLNRDVILSKANVLYRKESYSLKKEGIVVYDDRKVYKISFINNDPGSYSTGYGYPAPISSKGVIYIDTQTYAVLKYEHYVIRKPYELKDKTHMVQSTHKIIETYKIIDGKYFLNYINEITKNRFTTVKDNQFVKHSYTVYNLMSTDVNTKEVIKINRPILKLKQDVKSLNNSEFWKTNSFTIEDDTIEVDY